MVKLRPLRLGVAVLAVVTMGGVPIHAVADDSASAILAAKGGDGPDGASDLIDAQDIPTLGTAAPDGQAALAQAAAAAQAAGAHTVRSVQVNDPALDRIQSFPTITPPTRPFELSIQSETSVAAFGEDVVAGFNNSADQPIVQKGNSLAFVHRFLSAVGVSHDGGRTWTESSLPPVANSTSTFGDPAVAVDRQGNFYYASLGADATHPSLVFVGKSTDRGRTFQTGVTVANDSGADKEWIAVGPDPVQRGRDNVYVTWTSFTATGSRLMLGRSIDGGRTFTSSTVFAPADNGVESSFIQFSTPSVDPRTGRLFVPFLHFGDGSTDYVKVLISDDGGLTFRFSRFDVPGAPEPTAFPNVTPGTIADCGSSGGRRLVLHTGSDQGGGRPDPTSPDPRHPRTLPVFRFATRLVTQPMNVVSDGRLFIVLNSSTSGLIGDPSSRSLIRLLVSPDGGGSWRGPFTVVAATAAQPQHVHPTITVAGDGSLAIAYYTQLAGGQLRVDSARVGVEGDEGRIKAHTHAVAALGPAFDLIPSNVLLSAVPGRAPLTTNYDRTIRPCYDIGEYQGVAPSGDRSVFVWGDNRNQWTSPADSPAAGTHAQPDVFSARRAAGE